MTLRLFADHCISTAIVRELEGHGHEVLRLRDFIPRDSPDAVVIAQAQSRNAILLSLNGDFADIVTYPPAEYQGIIALEVRNHPEAIPAIMGQLGTYLAAHPDPGHYRGRLLVVEAHRIRIRE
jgi:predicted nuclease of predicted toxin-antitoxin system